MYQLLNYFLSQVTPLVTWLSYHMLHSLILFILILLSYFRTSASCCYTCSYLNLMYASWPYLNLMLLIYRIMFLPHGPYLNMRIPWGHSLLQYKYPALVLYKLSCKYCISFYAIFQVDLSHCANPSVLSY